MRIRTFMIAAAAALGLSAMAPAYGQNFQTDRVITAQEIEPAVTVMNDWSKKLYPGFKLTYSSDPNARQDQGFVALRSGERLIALFVSKYLSTGVKSTRFSKGQFAAAGITDRVFDELRAASYAESGAFETITMGNLNGLPGSVLVGLVESGAVLPGASACNCSVEYGKGWNDALDAAARLKR